MVTQSVGRLGDMCVAYAASQHLQTHNVIYNVWPTTREVTCERRKYCHRARSQRDGQIGGLALRIEDAVYKMHASGDMPHTYANVTHDDYVGRESESQRWMDKHVMNVICLLILKQLN